MKYFSIVAAAFFACAVTILTGPATASQVRLSAELGQTVLVPGKTSRAYLRVSLSGVKIASDAERTPVNIAIVIDRSGSMGGRKIRQAKRAAILAIQQLRPDDIVSVVTYDSSVEVIVPATRVADSEAIVERIRSLSVRGRTALYAGVEKGIDEVEKFLASERVNRVILLSDGLANVGPTSISAISELGRRAANRGIAITTIGLGLGYNEDLMSKLAFMSDGNHAFVEHPDDLVKIFGAEFGDVLSVVAQKVRVRVRFRNGFRPLRVLARTGKVSSEEASFRINQLYGGQEKYAIIEVAVPNDLAIGPVTVGDVQVSYANMVTGSLDIVEQTVRARMSLSLTEAKASLNKIVMAAVATQIGNELNEAAVKLRDKGKIKEAMATLKRSAAYLKSEAERLDSDELKALSAKTMKDAEIVAAPAASGIWKKGRKAMRARAYKLRKQQKF